MRLVTPIWEWVHNRATANILNRFKDLCEARFDRLTAGEPVEDGGSSPQEHSGVGSSRRA